MKERARSFRKSMTETENRMWYFLRDRRLNGFKFVREQVIGSYIADFVCRQKKLIVEVDGEHHADTDVMKYDQNRTEFLKKKGYKVFRVWSNDVFENIDGVLESILNELEKVPS